MIVSMGVVGLRGAFDLAQAYTRSFWNAFHPMTARVQNGRGGRPKPYRNRPVRGVDRNDLDDVRVFRRLTERSNRSRRETIQKRRNHPPFGTVSSPASRHATP